MRPARGVGAVVVALACASFVIWLLGWSTNLDPVGAVLGEPATVEVPDLSGLARPRAEADIRSAGLISEVDSMLSLTVPKGAVVSQSPEAGATVDLGSVVEFVVSAGIARVEMPDAVGQPLGDVVGVLERADVDYAVEETASEDVPEGIVISQEPGPGLRVTAADDVSFVVSTGPAPRPVPEVTGLSAQGGAYALGLAGFEPEVELRDDAFVPAGVVIGVEPAAGTVTPRDDDVLLVVSAGPPVVPLPELTGRPLASATGQLEELGLVPNVRGGGVSGGRVVSSDPVAGTPVRRGDMVVVEVRGG